MLIFKFCEQFPDMLLARLNWKLPKKDVLLQTLGMLVLVIQSSWRKMDNPQIFRKNRRSSPSVSVLRYQFSSLGFFLFCLALNSFGAFLFCAVPTACKCHAVPVIKLEISLLLCKEQIAT